MTYVNCGKRESHTDFTDHTDGIVHKLRTLTQIKRRGSRRLSQKKTQIIADGIVYKLRTLTHIKMGFQQITQKKTQINADLKKSHTDFTDHTDKGDKIAV